MAHGREARPCYHEHDMLIDNMLISYLLSRPPSLILEYKVAWPQLVASASRPQADETQATQLPGARATFSGGWLCALARARPGGTSGGCPSEGPGGRLTPTCAARLRCPLARVRAPG